jgi:hypothetical protein
MHGLRQRTAINVVDLIGYRNTPDVASIGVFGLECGFFCIIALTLAPPVAKILTSVEHDEIW